MRHVLALFAMISSLSGCNMTTTPAHQLSEQTAIPQWSSQYQIGNFQDKHFEQTLSPELQALLIEALSNNPQLQQQAFSLDQQLYQLQITHAQQWPQIDAFVSGQISGDQNNSKQQYNLGLNFSWEIDWLGKLDAQSQAASLDAKVAFELWQHQQIQLATQVVQDWFNLLEAQQQQQLSAERARNQQSNLDIIEQGYVHGLYSALDVYLGRSELNGVLTQLNQKSLDLKQQQQQLENRLGRYPAGTIQAQGQLDLNLPELPAGLPSELLQRRHDIKAAQYRLAAADLRVYAAYRDRFPSLSLTASGGQQSQELRQLLDAESLVWSLFAGISAPLFDGKRLENQQYQQYAYAQQLNSAYLETILTSFVEVEFALYREPILHSSYALLATAAEDAQIAEQLAFENYQVGINGYITVLESQRRAFDARSSAISALNQQLQNRLQLYLALGGGLENPQLERPTLNLEQDTL